MPIAGQCSGWCAPPDLQLLQIRHGGQEFGRDDTVAVEQYIADRGQSTGDGHVRCRGVQDQPALSSGRRRPPAPLWHRWWL
ncbi:MAG TPA: hypothetical protein VFC00_35610 [Micromonosporaceae bacterium]|nr:hypothetical protein [Micromonosporaceae bacterium]